jgi:tetratricopeptide (TPR) repeat protein
MRRLNLRLLLVLLAGLAVAGALIQGIHAVQVRRHSRSFLREADRAEQSGNPQQAADYLRRYLLLVPVDMQVMTRLGKLQFDQRRYREAQTLLSQVVQRDEKNEDARRLLVHASLRLGRYRDAQYHLAEFLLKSHPKDGKLFLQLGTCQDKLGEYRSAEQSYRAAIARDSSLIAAYETLAGLLAEHFSDSAASVPVLNEMVSRNSNNSESYIARGRFLQSHVGDPLIRAQLLDRQERADSERPREFLWKVSVDAKRALELAPNDPRALLFAAEVAFALGSLDEARRHAERASQIDRANPTSYLVLASVELRKKRTAEAAALLSRGLEATGDPILLGTLASLRMETNNLLAAKALVSRLEKSGAARPVVQYLGARLLIAERKCVEAVRQLEALGGDLKHWPELERESQFWLGRCYARLGREDLSVGAFRAALAIDPFWAPARLNLAESLLSLGRVDEALVEFQRLEQMPDAPPQLSVRLQRLKVLKIFSSPASDRDWTAIETQLTAALKKQPTADVVLLQAEVLVAKGNAQEARETLLAAIDAYPKEPVLSSALVTLASRGEKWDEAERVLRDMQARFGDGVTYRLTRAEYLVRRYGTSRKNELRLLAEPPSIWTAADRLNLALGLGRVALAVQDFDQAQKLFGRVADADPANLQIRLMLVDLAGQTSRVDDMRKHLAEIRAIEHDGPYWRYGEALRLAILAKRNNDGVLFDQAVGQLSEARLRFPSWSKVPLLVAEINDARGRRDAAMESYLAAFDLGEHTPGVVARLLSLLFDHQDYAKVETVIRKLQEEKAPFSIELTRLASQAAVRTGEFGRALSLARKSAAQSGDPRDRIALGQVLQITGETAAAEAELRNATTLMPKDAAAWIALVQFYATTGRKDLAKKNIDEAKTKIDAKQASAALAYAYQLVGGVQEADQTYDAAIKTAPDDFQIRRLSIEFKIRIGDMKVAESRLRELLGSTSAASDPQNLAWVRRTLALAVATAGTFPNYAEAQGLIEENLRQSPQSDVDRRARALVDVLFPTRANHNRAIRELELLLNRPGVLSPDDQIMLAKLHLAGGQWARASQVFREVVTRSKDPRHCAAYVEALLQEKELAEAEVWVRHLEEIAPGDFATVDLRARLLTRKQRFGEAFDRIVATVRQDTSDATTKAVRRGIASMRLEEFANDLTALGRGDESRRFLDQAESYLIAGSAGATVGSPDHVRFLLRHGRNEEAIAEFDRLRARGVADEIESACFAFASMRTNDRELLRRLEGLIAQVAQQRPIASAWVCLAVVEDRLDRYDAAEESYRKALVLDGTRVDALNNLAYLLGLRKKNLVEAQALIERAIAQGGPRGQFLDSRAVVELAAGRPDAALADSESAANESASPMHFFHQARVRLVSGQPDAARASMQKALALGLTATNIHPLEAAAYQELEVGLANRAR